MHVRTGTHAPNPYTPPHPSASFDTKSGLTPLVPFSHGQKQMDLTDAPSTEGDTHTALVSQAAHNFMFSILYQGE